MKFRLVRFNIYLCLVLILGWAGAGCQSDPAEKKAPKKGYSAISLHLEVNPDGTDKNSTVMVGRQTPFPVNVIKTGFLETVHLGRASVVEDEGGYKLRLQFYQKGVWLLEQYTVSNKGRRIAVYAELEDFRWLAAPVITQKISDGVLTFTPDASREEAENLALGLNKAIKKIRSQYNLNDPEIQ